MKSIDTLVDDIYGLFDGHDVSEGVDDFSKAVGDLFVRRLKDTEVVRRGLSLSQIGRPLRQLYYDLTGGTPNQEVLTPQTRFKFAYGDLIEEMILFLAMEAGHDVKDIQREVVVDGVLGHIDCTIDGVLVDVKSCSTYSFNKFATGSVLDDDPFGYVYQLSSYWSTLPDVDRAAFLAIDKVVGRICLYELTPDTRKTVDEVSGRILEIRECVRRGDEPNRCYPDEPEGKSGNRRLSVGCSYCPHKFHCWRDSNDGEGLRTYSYAQGPKFLTHIAREPRVQTFDKFPVKKQEEETHGSS